ncbi:MAG: HNH endonuclease family protein [Alphaproteobacteria bacterium]|nr:MAG: hypothetical protein B6I23_02785 [Rickettsiaceae bacterium 4572_127]
MPFSPKAEYIITSTNIQIFDFHELADEYVVRPPYQRKSVWSDRKKQGLMDSLFRRYYIPRLVIRKVRLSENREVYEIIDGQQRITTVQDFFNNKYPLPKSLVDIDKNLPGTFYKNLEPDLKKFVVKTLRYDADIINNINNPNNSKHQIVATKIFERLQQGESLNYMEIVHAELSSLTRNFIVKYSDDQTFDFTLYKPVENNPDKHKFFSLLNLTKDSVKRMKHLQFMARFLLIEVADGYADLSDKKIESFIIEAKKDDGIGDYSYENTTPAKKTLETLNKFYNIFKDDVMLGKDGNGKIKELSVEYLIISIYLLIRHLYRYYSFEKKDIKDFIIYFHQRWKEEKETDNSIITFCNKRQQGINDLKTRDLVIKQVFFEYINEQKIEIKEKDQQRAFSELQRLKIYRKSNGVCQQCLRNGLPEKEATISWNDYQADHVIPHSKGGQTIIENAELLCSKCNQSKGAKI